MECTTHDASSSKLLAALFLRHCNRLRLLYMCIPLVDERGEQRPCNDLLLTRHSTQQLGIQVPRIPF